MGFATTSDAPPYEKKGWEEVYGQFGETLRTPVPKPIPGGFKVGDPYLNLSTCRIEPLPTKTYPINFGGASLSTENETVVRVKDSDVDMGSFKNNAFVQNMGVVQKTKTLWHGPNGEVKEIKTNIGEFYSYRDSAYVPFERGAYYFASVFGDTLQPDLLFLPKFNRLIYPDGTVVRFGVPDLIWDNYFLNLGLPCVGSTYTKAGIVWHINSGRPGKNKLLEAGDYLEDKAKKQLIKIDTAFWSRGLAPDGCRLVNPEEGTIQGSGTDSYRLYNIYIYDICTGE